MIIFFVLFIALFSCSSKNSIEGDIYARIGNQLLTKKNIANKTNSGLVSPSSVLHLTNNWVEKTLLYEAAINANLNKDRVLIEKKNSFYKDLLVSSFLELESKRKVNISKKEVSNYYRTHKKSFTRQTNEVLLKHFVLPTRNEAIKLKKLLKSNKKGGLLEEYVFKYKPETKTIKENLVADNKVGFIFKNTVGDILGPKKMGSSYHVFEILRKNKKNSFRGLELVSDEIHQRLLKKKEAIFLTSILDSLYLNADVYISPEVRK